jgi:hypothetical protein
VLQTKELIIIGGPSCAGKSFLIKRIRRGVCPGICEQLGIGVPSSWRYVSASKLPHIDQSTDERLIVHYDFFSHQSQEDGFKYLHELISNSDRATVLTLCTSPEILAWRVRLKILTKFGRSLFHLRARKKKAHSSLRLYRKRKIYMDGYSVRTLYGKWFSFLDKYMMEDNLVLDSSKPDMRFAHPYEPARAKALVGVE